MLGAIYTALSGMNAYSRGLQTISNNVANLNTLGYKATSVRFTDLFSSGGAGVSFTQQTLGARTGDGVRLAEPLIDFR
jgi:flagellar hook protein FlgE